MTETVVRPAEAADADADAVFALVTAFATSYRPTRTGFDETYPLLLAGAANGSVDLLIAEADKTVVGYALAVRFPVLFASGSITELQELMVAPEVRGSGMGGRLVRAVVQRAEAAGCVEVTVPTRRAAAYYQRFGFHETATFLKLKLVRP